MEASIPFSNSRSTKMEPTCPLQALAKRPARPQYPTSPCNAPWSTRISAASTQPSSCPRPSGISGHLSSGGPGRSINTTEIHSARKSTSATSSHSVKRSYTLRLVPSTACTKTDVPEAGEGSPEPHPTIKSKHQRMPHSDFAEGWGQSVWNTAPPSISANQSE